MKIIKILIKKITDFQASIVLSLFFFLLVPLFALIVKSSRKKDRAIWKPWDIPSDTLEDVKKQY